MRLKGWWGVEVSKWLGEEVLRLYWGTAWGKRGGGGGMKLRGVGGGGGGFGDGGGGIRGGGGTRGGWRWWRCLLGGRKG